MEDCASAEKQKRFPPRIDPKARAKNEVKTAAEISKTLLYNSDRGATISCKNPRIDPSRNAIGISMSRAWKAIFHVSTADGKEY